MHQEINPNQSIELLKELHILTRDGKMNQDSRRKLKQVYHLYQFIENILNQIDEKNETYSIADMGAGKSYLGFILYDLFFKNNPKGNVYSIEFRDELVSKSKKLAADLGFNRMEFISSPIHEATAHFNSKSPLKMVTALHACDTATDETIDFALKHQVPHLVLIPCCQAEVARTLKKNKGPMLAKNTLVELWRHPIHTREFGSHLSNVLRCLRLESHGYQVTVTELTGWEHSMKNELIIAEFKNLPKEYPRQRLQEIIRQTNLEEINFRFS